MPFCIQTTQSNREMPYRSANAVLHRPCLKIRRKCRWVSQVPELFTLPLPGHSISTNTGVGLQKSQGLLQFGFEIKSNVLYITSIVRIILMWSCVKLLGVGLPVNPAYV